jgi:D-sedoheptulose 7-phosphate isomerase
MAIPPERPNIFEQALADHMAVIKSLPGQLPILERIAGQMTRAMINGSKILLFGNGGSAADAQHLAAELVGRFRRERRGLTGHRPHDRYFDSDGGCK